MDATLWEKIISDYSSEELKDIQSKIQKELSDRQSHALDEAWEKAQNAISEYLKLGGCITFLWFNPENGVPAEYTADAGEIYFDKGAIHFDNY